MCLGLAYFSGMFSIQSGVLGCSKSLARTGCIIIVVLHQALIDRRRSNEDDTRSIIPDLRMGHDTEEVLAILG